MQPIELTPYVGNIQFATGIALEERPCFGAGSFALGRRCSQYGVDILPPPA
jgi:hypothetical protein